MKFTVNALIYLMFSILLILLGIWNYVSASIVTNDIIATSIVLVVIGATLGVSLFIPRWIKAAIFIDGLIFAICSIFLSIPYNYVFVIFGLILIIIAILAYIKKLPNSILALFYKT